MTLAIKSSGTGQWGTEQGNLFGGKDNDALADKVEKIAETATATFRGAADVPAKAPGASLATTTQKNLLRTMIGEREGAEGLSAIRERLNKALEGGYLTKAIFTEVFTALKAIPRTDPTPQAPVVRPPKVNLYAGDCNACGRRVEGGAGFVMRGDEDKWVVWHEVCPTAFPFPEGRYAIDNADGELRFYHLIDGEVFVMASDEEHLIHGLAAQAIIAKIAEDPLEAAKRYGMEIGACGICGRTLTSEWRLVGIGPVCSTRGFGG